MGEKKNNVMLIGYYDYYSMKTHYLLQSMYYQYLKANENRSRWMIPGTISYRENIGSTKKFQFLRS